MRTEAELREILGDAVQPDGSLYDLGCYISWARGDDTATLDCQFSASELRAIADWMDLHK